MDLRSRKCHLQELVRIFRAAENKSGPRYSSILERVSAWNNANKKNRHQESLLGSFEYITSDVESGNFIEDIDQFYNQAKNFGCEGVVIKPLDYIGYMPDNKTIWVKYNQNSQEKKNESLDLVVMGAYKGTGKRSGTFGSFLVGVYDDTNHTYRPVSKLGSGFSESELAIFYELLKPFI